MNPKDIAKKALRLLPDRLYISLLYYKHFHKFPNLKNPRTFNEKLQWLKLHDRRPEYTTMVDKYAAKQYIADKVGEKYVIPTLGVWDRAEDIDFDALPDQFVLKTNHDSKGVVICKDKSQLDIDRTVTFLNKRLSVNGYWYGREWPYKNVLPKIIAEKFLLEDADAECLTDYKFFCFGGVAKIMYISKDVAIPPTTDFFDMDFNHLDIRMKDGPASVPPSKPVSFNEMKRIAEILSSGTRHLRVDFYEIDGHPYVGELTFFHNSGFGNVNPEQWSTRLGSWIKL